VDTAYKSVGFVSATQDLSSAVATYYNYGSLRTEPRGRGLLGFHWLQATDSETHLVNRTVFRQDFPYTGMVAFKGVGQGGSWNNLDLTTTTYGCTMLEVASACALAPGNRYFVYPMQVTHQLWDLDGTAMPVESVTYENPDNYGNLQIVTKKILTPALADTDYKTVTTTNYWNDPNNWFLGRPLKVVTAHTGPTVASPVVPGSGGLPLAPPPVLPPKLAATVLMPILSLLLSD
jgi:hypothetical protein